MVQRRAVKLPYRELYISCPHCKTSLRIGTIKVEPLVSERTCPKCGKEFLIENDVPKKLTSAKKPSESVHAAKPAKRTKSR